MTIRRQNKIITDFEIFFEKDELNMDFVGRVNTVERRRRDGFS
jgi:hypothetical protein